MLGAPVIVVARCRACGWAVEKECTPDAWSWVVEAAQIKEKEHASACQQPFRRTYVATFADWDNSTAHVTAENRARDLDGFIYHDETTPPPGLE